MPRRKPIPKQDREIAARIKEFRVNWKCTRPHLAAQIEVTPETLTRIENGRVPLKYGIARKILSYLPINPHWAATGKGLPKGYIVLPSAEELKVSENALFSDVFMNVLLPSFKNEDVDFQLAMLLRYHRGLQMASLVRKAFRDVPDNQIGEFRKNLERFIFGFLAKGPEDDPKIVLQRQLWYKNSARFFESPNAEQPHVTEETGDECGQNKSKDALDNMPGISDSVRVSKQIRSLPELMIALRERTKLRGQKAALARELKVTRQAIDQWLSGNAKPSAEITFELLKRVEQQERQK